MPPTKDFYAVLGVSPSATADEIKKQYRRLAKQYHPDANANDPKAADRFKEISEAWQVLGDAEKRKQYDEMRTLGAFGGFGGGTSRARSRSATPGGASGGPGGAPFPDFDVGGFGGIGDLFSSIFGQNAPGNGGARATGTRGGRGAERGQTVETTLEVPFRTAALGGKVPIELDVTEECATCRGTGGAPGATTKTCGECAGRGVISFGQGGFAVNRPCPACMGRGQIPSERCPACRGSGETRQKRKVLITVPPGAETGTKVRLRGQGGRGASGGEAGDLVITFQVQADRFYGRDGLDIIATVPLNIAQATLGSKVSVRTLGGQKVAVRIPPGTPGGKRFRIPGQGIDKDGRKGDMLVEVTITVPEQLTEAQQQAMRQFAEASGLKY
ncbi:MAG: J domain-containing protein [Gemmatimonadaceae bacterium]|nr:J domain-containing protein [Gemmatimonadaceae bacterium]